MLTSKNIKEIIKRYEKHTRLIERDYNRKNIKHRLREDFGYGYTLGKIAAYKYILKELA